MSNPYAPKKKSAPAKVEEAKVEETKETTYDVPTGSVDKVMKWVGDDAAKAKAAYDVETDGKQRSSLLEQLKELF